MKIKTAFTLSLIVNAVLLAAVAYMLSINMENLHNEPFLPTSGHAQAEPSKSTPAPASDLAGLRN